MKKHEISTRKLALLKNKIANVNYLESINGGVEGNGGNPGKSNRTSSKPSDPVVPFTPL